VNSVSFSPDGTTLATASSDRTVRLWKLVDRRDPVSIEVLTGHSSPVNSVSFSPDGTTLATASSDRTVRLWNRTDLTGSVLKATLTGQSGVVRSVAFASDGHTLATGGDDATTVLWDLNTLHAFRATERACSITGGGLNRDEWARYIPGLPYEDTCTD